MVIDIKRITNDLDLYRLLAGYERDSYFNRYYVVDQPSTLKLMVLYDAHNADRYPFLTMRFLMDVSKYEDSHHLLTAVDCAGDNLRVYDLVRRLRHMLLDAESRKRWASPWTSGD